MILFLILCRAALRQVLELLVGSHGGRELRPYRLGGRETAKWLLVKHGSHERPFKMAHVSNEKVGIDEYTDWARHMELAGLPPPLVREAAALEAKIGGTADYRWDVKDIKQLARSHEPGGVGRVCGSRRGCKTRAARQRADSPLRVALCPEAAPGDAASGAREAGGAQGAPQPGDGEAARKTARSGRRSALSGANQGGVWPDGAVALRAAFPPEDRPTGSRMG